MSKSIEIHRMIETPSIEERLLAYDKSGVYPFHMPGHKRRNGESYSISKIDVTEVEGTDNLHYPTDMLADGMKLAASVYGASQAYYLVNGSSGGLLSAIDATTNRGDEILIARNCHKCVYNAIALKNLRAHYLWPTRNQWGLTGQINPNDVDDALRRHPNCKVVLITSPTYDGVLSDTEQIAKIVHQHQGILVVDSAHGAHLGFHQGFPNSEVTSGADLIIVSAHKTLSAYTQSALLFRQGNRVNKDRLQESLGVFQSSSPSYILMAGLDRSVRELAQIGEQLMEALHLKLVFFQNQMKRLKNLHLLAAQDLDIDERFYDPSKILISTKDCYWLTSNGSARGEQVTGVDLATKLRTEANLEVEMVAASYVLLLTSYMDEMEGFKRLARAVEELDRRMITGSKTDCPSYENGAVLASLYQEADPEMDAKLEIAMTIGEAKEADKLEVVFASSEGYISGEFVYLYPPGIPIIVPGEVLSKEIIDEIQTDMDNSMNVEGLADYTNKWIKVVK